MRAYIEPHDKNEDNWSIQIHINGILAGKVEMPPRIWLYTHYNKDGDLVINHSEGMEPYKWDHITKQLLEVKEIK